MILSCNYINIVLVNRLWKCLWKMYHKICVHEGTYQVCCRMCMSLGSAVCSGTFCAKWCWASDFFCNRIYKL